MLLVGISKGGFGGGLGMLAVPMMSLTMPPFQAAAILLPLLCLADVIGLWAYRRKWDARNLKFMMPGAVIGIVIGALLVGVLDEHVVRLVIGFIALAFAANWFLGKHGAEPTRPNLWKGSLWAAVSGFTSFLAHAGGPPASIYLLPQRMDKTIFVGTTIVFFAAVNYVKIVPYALLGQFPAGNLLTSLVLGPVAAGGMALGLWLHDKVGVALFYRICYGFLAIVGLKLIVDGLGL